jgi:hypothetical protein
MENSLWVLFIGLMIAVAHSVAEDSQEQSKTQQDIIGSWTLVSAKYNGTDFSFPEGSTHIKHVTPTQFMWATYDKDGRVNRTAGGSYTLKGDAYEETPEYGISQDFDIIKGKAQSFKCRIEGNKWHHDGKLSNGLTIEEVWQRVERK